MECRLPSCIMNVRAGEWLAVTTWLPMAIMMHLILQGLNLVEQ